MVVPALSIGGAAARIDTADRPGPRPTTDRRSDEIDSLREGCGVLTIAKMGVGQEGYYLAKVASGIEDYYSGAGETTGRWIGRGSARLGLDGEVGSSELRALLAGMAPDGRSRLSGQAGHVHTPGWDMTFSAPKSVSILYGLGGVTVAEEVAAAHDAAVDEALRWLEEQATVSRRRFGGQIVAVKGEGLVVAAFRHRTSRLGDPQLHTHALAANVVERNDGTWGALDSRPLYRQAKTAGFLYQAVLRSQLTERLGVAWGDVTNGVAEIAGTNDTLMTLFSKRRAQIVESVAAAGERMSAKAAQVAAYRTRPSKVELEGESIYARWAAQAEDAGVSLDEVVGVTGDNPTPTVTDDQLDEVVDHMVDPRRGLCAADSCFDRGAMARSWCEHLPVGTALDYDAIDSLIDRATNDRRIIEVDPGRGAGPLVITPDGNSRPVGVGDRRWSTAELLAVEQRMLRLAMLPIRGGTSHIDLARVEEALAARPDLGPDQAEMVRRITTSTNAVDVVVGRAGTGKTYALAAAVTLWREAGYEPIGLALAARAAAELHHGAGLPATTVARLFADAQRTGTSPLTSRSVVVVDEAAMVDTRRLATLLDMSRAAGAKVVLVGDHHQLPPVEVGGSFAALVERLEPIELTANRRQVHGWERELLADLRVGHDGHDGIRRAIDTYADHDRIHVDEHSDDVRARMVDDWFAATTEGRDALMVALRREDVRDLNDRIRALLINNGHLVDDGAVSVTLRDGSTRSFVVGDRVVCGRNDQRLGVHNALAGVITAIDSEDEHNTVTFGGREGGTYTVPLRYLEAGDLDHGYATSIHKAQGSTVDVCALLGDDRLYRQAGYTALSRGRNENRLYLVGVDDRDQFPELELERHGILDPDDPFERIVRSLYRDGAKALATDEADEHRLQGATTGQPLHDLWTEWDALAGRIHSASTDSSPAAMAARERLLELEHDIEWRTRQAAHAAELDRPARVTGLIGDPPSGDRTAWRTAAGAIESYEARWDGTPHELRLDDPAHDDHQRRVEMAIAATHCPRLPDMAIAVLPI